MFGQGQSGAQRSVRGAKQRPVSGHQRAGRLNRPPQMRLTPGYPESTHCQQCLRNPPVPHAERSNASDGPRGNSPERATRRRTSPSAHACPTPHSGKTPRRPAPCTPTRTPPLPVRLAASGTRPTHPTQPRRQAPTPRTHVVAPAPDAHARRTSAPRAQARPGHARLRMRTRQPPVFRVWPPCARHSGNKSAASAHGIGSGGLAVDNMVVRCLGVETRGERFFALSHFARRSARRKGQDALRDAPYCRAPTARNIIIDPQQYIFPFLYCCTVATRPRTAL
jgi:hypothetical protein